MADLKIHLYAVLAALEILLILMMLGGALFFQLRGARRDAAQLKEQLQQATSVVRREVVEHVIEQPAAPQRDYADFLRDQLEHSNQLLGEHAGEQAEGALTEGAADSADARARQMLAVRHQFLQFELDVQGVASTADAEAQRQTVIAGMQALLEGLRLPTAETPVESASEPEAEPVIEPLVRSEVNRLQDQISHLRSVIDNQHGVMRELRHLLEEHGGESEELQEALRKLGDAEAQAVELQRCLEVMDHENERLKATRERDSGAPGAGPDADMLRDLVGSQQRTIGKLQHMLQSLAPDSGKAKELGDAIGKIQRANSELNSCVMVLEDENTMLRGQVESLQERLASLEATTNGEPGPGRGPEPEPVASAENVNGVDDIDALLAEASPAQQPSPDTPDGLMQEDPDTALAAADLMPAAAGGADDDQLDTDDLLAELFGGTRNDDAADTKSG
ncbi:MAG TPA: hypothetical protein VIR60_06645 [Gammaproteobacteria bacterium]